MSLYNLFTHEDIKKINEWDTAQREKMPKDENGLVLGAIGGYLTYEFTPTSLGTVVKVVNNITRDVLDLTDYGSW